MALKFVLSGKHSANLVGLARLLRPFGLTAATLNQYYRDLQRNAEFTGHIEGILSKMGEVGQTRGGSELYMIVRALRPNIVVETGVSAGFSTAYMLQAMADNQLGKLYSIDIPNYELEYFPKIGKNSVRFLPDGVQTGFAVPDRLKLRWELRVGKAQHVLQALLDEVGKIDLFLHDSEHTYANMMLEFRVAWDHLTNDGLLLADDVSWNKAFSHFARAVSAHREMIPFTGIGGMVRH
jgi:predicted O-methyltransferase YrrM